MLVSVILVVSPGCRFSFAIDSLIIRDVGVSGDPLQDNASCAPVERGANALKPLGSGGAGLRASAGSPRR